MTLFFYFDMQVKKNYTFHIFLQITIGIEYSSIRLYFGKYAPSDRFQTSTLPVFVSSNMNNRIYKIVYTQMAIYSSGAEERTKKMDWKQWLLGLK